MALKWALFLLSSNAQLSAQTSFHHPNIVTSLPHLPPFMSPNFALWPWHYLSTWHYITHVLVCLVFLRARTLTTLLSTYSQVLKNCLRRSRCLIHTWWTKESIKNHVTNWLYNGNSSSMCTSSTHTQNQVQAQEWIKCLPLRKSEWRSSLIQTELRDPTGSQSQGWQGSSA